jgi:sec-independent protein translocase protein TatA
MTVLAPGIGPFGIWELLLILLIVVLVFGVGRLPEVGGALGKSIREFRKSTQEGSEEAPGAASTGVPSVTASTPSQEVAAGGGDTFCTECGTRNPSSAKFCASCGNRITAPVG